MLCKLIFSNRDGMVICDIIFWFFWLQTNIIYWAAVATLRSALGSLNQIVVLAVTHLHSLYFSDSMFHFCSFAVSPIFQHDNGIACKQYTDILCHVVFILVLWIIRENFPRINSNMPVFGKLIFYQLKVRLGNLRIKPGYLSRNINSPFYFFLKIINDFQMKGASQRLLISEPLLAPKSYLISS